MVVMTKIQLSFNGGNNIQLKKTSKSTPSGDCTPSSRPDTAVPVIGFFEICHNRIVMELFWMSGHSGDEGNEKAGELAWMGSDSQFYGPESYLALLTAVAIAHEGTY
jgi:ribonuclease HI